MSVAAAEAATRDEPARLARSFAFWRSRPALAAALIYAVLSLIMVGQGLLPGRTFTASDLLYGQVPWLGSKPATAPPGPSNFELADAANVFQPFLQYTRARLPDAPLWNPYLMGGRPFIGNAQSAVFTPFSVPSYVLPFWKSLAVVAFVKLFLAAFGTFMLGWALGMRFGGALLSGLVFAFGTFFIVWLAWPLTSIFCLIPWLLLCTELFVRRPGSLSAAAVAGLVALVLVGGHPESSFHVMFAGVVWFAFRLALHHRRDPDASRASLGRSVLAYAGALALGVGVAMIALAPFLELLLHSGDLSRRLGAEEASHWPRRYLGALLLHDYWGRPTQTDLEAFMVIRGWYAGALTLMLAAAALVLRMTATRIAIAVFAAFSACMVLGIPPLFQIVERLPGFSTAHNERLLIFVLFTLALLAGFGLDELSAKRLPTPRRRWVVGGIAVALATAPVAWMALAGTLTPSHLRSALGVAWGFEHPPTTVDATTATIVRTSSLLIWLPLAAAGVGLVLWRLRERGRLPAVAFIAVAVALIAVDLFRANLGFNPSIPIASASQPATGAIRYLQSRRPQRFVGVGTAQFAQPLPPDTGMHYGLYDARGYDYPVEKHFDRLWRRNVAPTVGDFTQPVAFADRTPAALRAFNLLSVSDLIADPRDPPLRRPGLRVAYKGPDAVVYANAQALPRVLLVDRQSTASGDSAALAAVTAPGFDARRVAVTHVPVAGIPQTGTGAAARSRGAARLVSYEPERVVTDASSPRRTLLVLTDVAYPGWTATVDGHPAKIQRVDYLLRGIVVPPGRHRIEMRYQPGSWRFGWIVSLSSLLILAGLVVAGLRRRRVA